jgi:hypothetical protein
MPGNVADVLPVLPGLVLFAQRMFFQRHMSEICRSSPSA